jgi:hypothetical protein
MPASQDNGVAIEILSISDDRFGEADARVHLVAPDGARLSKACKARLVTELSNPSRSSRPGTGVIRRHVRQQCDH